MYFKNFPKLVLQNASGHTAGSKVAVDILRRVGFSDRGKTGSQYFFNYSVKETDTPENVADRMYGSPEYHWIVLMFNNIHDPFFEWPLSGIKFQKHLAKKYQGTTLFLGEGITGTFKIGDTVGVIVSGLGPDGETGFGGVVDKYDPTTRQLRVTGLDPSESFNSQDIIQSYNSDGGTGWDQYVGGATIERIVTDSTQSLHHFGTSGSITAGYDDIGGGTATSSIILDPLSKYDGLAQVSLADGSVFSDTLIYGYIFNSTNDYVITNYQYENDLNDSRRSISLLRSEYVPQILDEFKQLIKT